MNKSASNQFGKIILQFGCKFLYNTALMVILILNQRKEQNCALLVDCNLNKKECSGRVSKITVRRI